MAFSTNSDAGGPMATINVVPLVDVMLVLLIIFMVTTPLMQHLVEVELPEATITAPDDEPPPVPPVTIAVTDDGRLFWNDEPVTAELLESRLSVEAQKVPQPGIQVRGDKTTKYSVVNNIVQIAQRQGMRKVGFISLQEN
jgi:biopolymer transport protein ExbD